MPNDDPIDPNEASDDHRRRRDAAVDRLRRELRRQVRASDMTQRAIEDENGFSHGYLSQVLQGHVTLTMRHVLGVLMALDLAPDAFFRRFFGEDTADLEAPIDEIRERLARYDAAFKQLEEKGVLTPGTDSEPEA